MVGGGGVRCGPGGAERGFFEALKSATNLLPRVLMRARVHAQTCTAHVARAHGLHVSVVRT